MFTVSDPCWAGLSKEEYEKAYTEIRNDNRSESVIQCSIDARNIALSEGKYIPTVFNAEFEANSGRRSFTLLRFREERTGV